MDSTNNSVMLKVMAHARGASIGDFSIFAQSSHVFNVYEESGNVEVQQGSETVLFPAYREKYPRLNNTDVVNGTYNQELIALTSDFLTSQTGGGSDNSGDYGNWFSIDIDVTSLLNHELNTAGTAEHKVYHWIYFVYGNVNPNAATSGATAFWLADFCLDTVRVEEFG